MSMFVGDIKNFYELVYDTLAAGVIYIDAPFNFIDDRFNTIQTKNLQNVWVFNDHETFFRTKKLLEEANLQVDFSKGYPFELVDISILRREHG